jgi:hypothetical protein
MEKREIAANQPAIRFFLCTLYGQAIEVPANPYEAKYKSEEKEKIKKLMTPSKCLSRLAMHDIRDE